MDNDLVNFYRVIQNHLEEFLKQFKWLLTSRTLFNEWKEQMDASGLTDIQRAARYFYLQKLCYGGKVKGRTFGTAVDRKPRINLLRLEEELSEIHLRLCETTVECLSWDKFVEKYDRENTFFYIDPPYYQKPCYKHNFDSLDDFIHMNSILSNIKGKFLLSINDTPEIRDVFKNFDQKEVSLNYSVGKDSVCKANELLIKNY